MGGGTAGSTPSGGTTGSCGDGTLNAGEVCDDGNSASGDGCSADCSVANCLVPTQLPTIQTAHDQKLCPTIWIAPGVYTENLTLDHDVVISGSGSVRISGARRGRTLSITSGQVTLRDVVISDGLASSGGCIHNQGSLTLERVEVRGCEANGTSPRGAGIANFGALTLHSSKVHDNIVDATPTSLKTPGEIYGGGIYSVGGALTLDASEITENVLRTLDAEDMTLQGAGIYAGDSDVKILGNSIIRGNRVEVRGGGKFLSAGLGGGIYQVGGTLSFAASTVADNVLDVEAGSGDSAEAFGGGIYLNSLSPPIFKNARISGNLVQAKGTTAAARGAGVFVRTAGATFADCKILGNQASAEGGEIQAVGGGVAAGSGESVHLLFERSWLSGNSVVADRGAAGGGIYLQSLNDETRGEVEFVSSLAEGNAAMGVGAQGGFLYGLVFERANLGVSVSNSTVSGNSAEAAGGGLTLHAGLLGLGEAGAPRSVDLDVRSATVTENRAVLGGAFFIDTSEASVEVNLDLQNSIVTRNQAEGAANCPASPPIISRGYNLLGGETCRLIASNTDQLDVDPQLKALGDVGETRAYALLPGSPAIDAGDPSGCRDRSGALIETDQRSAPRVVGGRCDIGAYEAP
jgi:cysteine-rich repeat protein